MEDSVTYSYFTISLRIAGQVTKTCTAKYLDRWLGSVCNKAALIGFFEINPINSCI